MRYFIRIGGALFEVLPLTLPSGGNPSIKIRVIRTGTIMRVPATSIIRDY